MIEEQINRYRDIKPSVRRLWQFFRKNGEDSTCTADEFKELLRDSSQDHISDDLSRVLIFYKRLADLFNQGKISKEEAMRYWRKDDVSILEKIAIPMNKALYEFMGREDMDLRTINPFLSIYHDPIVDISVHSFDIALSFPGEERFVVEQVADEIRRNIGPNACFYDNYYKAQLARPNLDLLLQDIYRFRSKLVVAFLCEKYQEKEWCGLEFRAIRDILLRKEVNKIMYVRMDDGEVEGVFLTDGYVDARTTSPEKLAGLILERFSLL